MLALAAVIERAMLSSSLVKPAPYVLIISLLGGATALFIGLGFLVLSSNPYFVFIVPPNAGRLFTIGLAAGALYPIALYFYFSLLSRNEVSRVVPVLGALVPIFILIMSVVLLGEKLLLSHIAAIILLICGTVLLTAKNNFSRLFIRTDLYFLVLCAFLFAAHYALAKGIYSSLPFVQSALFIQFGDFAGGVILYLVLMRFQRAPRATTAESSRMRTFVNKILKRGHAVSDAVPQPRSKGVRAFLILVSQLFGGVGGILLQISIFLGSVALVNALQGVQFAFLFIILLVAKPFFGSVLSEEWETRIFIQKAAGVLCVGAGIAFIAFLT